MKFYANEQWYEAVPQKLLDACEFIDDLFSETNWKSKLTKNKKLLDEVFSKKTLLQMMRLGND